jgi:uncharacterized membrane protein
MLLARALAAAPIIWLALLTFAAAGAGSSFFPSIREFVFAFASHVCHQQPDRSFHWGGTAWPVCARCLGLYAAAPLGAMLALAVKTPARIVPARNILLLSIAALPTGVTWVAEHGFGAPLSNELRFVAALPLGAAVAWLLVRTILATARGAVSQYTLQDARRGQAR